MNITAGDAWTVSGPDLKPLLASPEAARQPLNVTVPPHACWACKVTHDEELATRSEDEPHPFYVRLAEALGGEGRYEGEDADWEKRLAVAMVTMNAWVDETMAETHRDHQPGSWVG